MLRVSRQSVWECLPARSVLILSKGEDGAVQVNCRNIQEVSSAGGKVSGSLFQKGLDGPEVLAYNAHAMKVAGVVWSHNRMVDKCKTADMGRLSAWCLPPGT